MTQIPKRYIAILIAVCSIAPLLLGFRGYGLLSEPARDGSQARLAAEGFLFLSVVATVVVIGVFVFTMLRGRAVERELDKIVEMTRQSGFSPHENLRRLGSLGTRIAALYDHLDDLNERRAAKISSLAAMLDYLLANTDHALAIADASGTITHASRRFKGKQRDQDEKAVGKNISRLFPDLDFRSQLLELERSRTPREVGRGSKHLWLFPVFNKHGDLAAVIADQASEIEVPEVAGVNGPSSVSPKRGNIIQRAIFSRLSQRR